MWCDDDDAYPANVRFQVHYSLAEAKASNSRSDLETVPCLVLPMPSLKSARAKAKWENLSEEEKVGLLTAVMHNKMFAAAGYRQTLKDVDAAIFARACLAVMGGAP